MLDATKTLTYTVTVKDGAWNTTLINGVTPTSTGWRVRHRGGLLDDPHHPEAPEADHRQGGRQRAQGDALKTWWNLTADRQGGAVAATPSSLAGHGGDSGSVAQGTYDLAEADVALDGHDTSGYSASSWSCVRTGTTQGVTSTSTTVTLDFGDDVTCTITNTQIGHWKIAKTADRPDLATYKPGETIHYTLTATHTSGVAPTGVVVHDDLTELLKHATAPVSWPAGVSGPDANDVITWDVGTLPTTKSVSFDFVVKARPSG